LFKKSLFDHEVALNVIHIESWILCFWCMLFKKTL